MKNRAPIINFLRFVLLITTAGTILILSLMSDPPEFANVTLWDKGNHFLAYFGLSAIFFTTFFKKTSRIIRLLTFSVICSALYGALIEVLQNLTGRHMDSGDLLANLIGALIGSLTAWGIITLIMKVSKKRIKDNN